MIQFKCPKCQTLLKIADDKAGTVVTCKECDARLKAPLPKKAPPKTSPAPVKKKPAEDVEEVVPDDDEEDEAPRKKKPARSRDVEIEEDRPRKGKGKTQSRRAEEDEDDLDDEDDRPRRKRRRRDDDDDAPSGKSVVSGIVYILLGIAVAAVGVIAPSVMELQVNKMIPMIFGPVAGLLLAGLGVFYIVRK